MIYVYKCDQCKFTKAYEQDSLSQIVRKCLTCNITMSYTTNNRPPFLTYKAKFGRDRKPSDYGLGRDED